MISNFHRFFFIALFWLCLSGQVTSQTIFPGFSNYEEYLRREQAYEKFNSAVSFTVRPLYSNVFNDSLISNQGKKLEQIHKSKSEKDFKFRGLPVFLGGQFSSPVPALNTDIFLPTKGLQTYLSLGFFAKWKFLQIQFRPEYRWSENPQFFTGNKKSVYTEYLERYGEGRISSFNWGQSHIRAIFGPLSIGFSTENIWWGPGQWNSMTFTNNALGFKHFSLNTVRPINTFIGSFEGQVISGRLDGFGEGSIYFDDLLNDWRYLNGVIITYSPKWVPGLFVGASRTFQQYDSYKGESLSDYFPIFNAFQKEVYGFDKDQEGRDQQATIFSRFILPKAKTELYFEYGRRDHAVNWREAFLNPEHARGYLVGFTKILNLKEGRHFQIRSEIYQQQESINTILRNGFYANGINWGGHAPVSHGFTNRGQMINTGYGPSSNVQTLEASFVENLKKIGLKFDRINRHQDIYNSFYADPSEEGRWIDYRITGLVDWKINGFIISTQSSLVKSLNYQWGLDQSSTTDFPQGRNLLSFNFQVMLIYSFKEPF